MRHTKLLLLAMVVAGGPGLASAQELRPVANPEQLGFSTARLQRLTETYQGYVDRGELPGSVLLIARGEKHVWSTAWADIMTGGITPQAAADKAFKRIEEIFTKYQIASG